MFFSKYKNEFLDFSWKNNLHKGCVATIVLASVMIKQGTFSREKEWRLVKWLLGEQFPQTQSMQQSKLTIPHVNAADIPSGCIYAGLANMGKPFSELIQGVTLSPSSIGMVDEVVQLFRASNIPVRLCDNRSIVRLDNKNKGAGV